MNAKEARKYIAENEDSAEARQVNLTPEQVDIISDMAQKSGLSFEDMVMVLLHVELDRMDKVIKRVNIQEQARRN